SRLKPKPSTYKLPSKLLLGNWAIAVCALLAVVALGLFSGPSSSSHTHWVSAIGEQKQIRLEDGTQILLNTNSQLEVDFSRDHRLARLVRGEAYFDVHPNPARPFDVETMQGMVRVLGTHFSVQQQAADTLVTVLEGRVALGAAAAPEQPFKALVELLPNQQLSLQQAATGSAPRTINAKAALAWRDKQLVAQKQPLVEVVEELERYYPVNIDLAEPALGAREVTAVIQISALDVTLAALCRPLNLIPQYSPDRTRVTLKPQT
ncbi:MAG TPA: FecR domain-containing protein, partial [Cellvibrionaceae bacterium]|nr:FecR domain-containing protein [Cellvibrionaceae bacterium]